MQSGRSQRDPQLAWLSSSRAGDIQWDVSGQDFTCTRRSSLAHIAKENGADDTRATDIEADATGRSLTGNSEPVDVGGVSIGDDEDDFANEWERVGDVASEEANEETDGTAADDVAGMTPSQLVKPAQGGYDLGISMGEHLTDTNVFTMETLSKRSVAVIMAFYYILFIVLVALSFLSVRRSEAIRQFDVLPQNGSMWTAKDKLCRIEGGSCKNSSMTVDEAELLANTVVVSSGINVSDWVRDAAKPGTPPFTAHDIREGSFLVERTILSWDANPELHIGWDNISGVFWTGHKGESIEKVLASSFKSILIDFVFEHPDKTPWPEGITRDDLSFKINAYACVRGDSNCASVGEYRNQFIDAVDKDGTYDIMARQQVKGNKYIATIHVPNTQLLEDIIEGIGWRLVADADPGKAVTDCAAGRNCIVHARITGINADSLTKTVIETAALCFYFPFFLWWVFMLRKRLGWDPNKWHVENQWVLIIGVGLLLYNGFLYVSLRIQMLKANYIFRERLWAASLLMTSVGEILQLFGLACFCDSPRRYIVSRFDFYKWKVLFCVVLCTAKFVATLMHFPAASGRDEPGTNLAIGGLGFVTAPETWPHHDKIVLTTFQILWEVCLFFSLVYYIVVSRKTTKVLRKLPYNMTRPVQLSFSFFKWVSRLWIIAETVSACVDIAYAVNRSRLYDYFDDHGGALNAAVVAINDMHIFVNHQHPAKLLYILGFTVIFEVFFLPPSKESIIKKTHHVTEEDAKTKTEEEISTGRSLLVLDRARLLCTCSRETYLPFDDQERMNFTGITQHELEALRSTTNDQNDASHASNDYSNIGKPVNMAGKSAVFDSWLPSIRSAKKGGPDPVAFARFAGASECSGGAAPPGSTWAMRCRVVKHIREPGYADMHNSRAILYRHEESNDLIIAFRGTKTKKQIKTDLMTQKVSVSLDSFLTIFSAREKARKAVEGLVPEDIEENMRKGTCGKVPLLDLLHKHDENSLPEFLKGRERAEDGVRGSSYLHFGFWSSYSRLRAQVHEVIYEALVSNPGRLLVTGHSLGGAQATACAYDMSRWIIPSVKKALQNQQQGEVAEQISLCCYTYGSPRLGCRAFREAFDRAVPETVRIVCDGDIVTTTPPKLLGFSHIGDEYVFDYTGSCARNPSLLEQKFAQRTRTHAGSHMPANYTRAIKRAYHPSIPTEKLLDLIESGYTRAGSSAN